MNEKDNAAEEIEEAGSKPLQALGLVNGGDAESVQQWTNEEEKKLVYVCDLLLLFIDGLITAQANH